MPFKRSLHGRHPAWVANTRPKAGLLHEGFALPIRSTVQFEGRAGRARRGPDSTTLRTGRWGQANQNLMGEARPKQPYVRRKTRITVG